MYCWKTQSQKPWLRVILHHPSHIGYTQFHKPLLGMVSGIGFTALLGSKSGTMVSRSCSPWQQVGLVSHSLRGCSTKRNVWARRMWTDCYRRAPICRRKRRWVAPCPCFQRFLFASVNCTKETKLHDRVNQFTTILNCFQSWLVVTGTMEFWMTFSWEVHPNWLSLHHFSEGLGSTTNQFW